MWDEFAGTLEDANQAGKSYKPNKADWLEGHWAGMSQADDEESASRRHRVARRR